MTTIHPDYAVLAARILVTNLHKQTHREFSKVITELYNAKTPKKEEPDPVVAENVYQVVMGNKNLLDEAVAHERDFEYSYFGIRTLEKSYLLKIGNTIVERPQHMLMRTSIGIHGNDIPKVIETYTLMSKRYFTHATSTLFNAGTVNPQMSSYFLVGLKDDTTDGVYDTLKTCAMISKHAGGIGLHAHSVRASGIYVDRSATSAGIVPMLKLFNATAKYARQNGRPSAFAVYLEPWHGDIFEFLDIRKNHGNEEMRARDILSALWIPDIFMEKVEAGLDWCLFSPDDVPGLVDAYGDDFRVLYEKYENQEKYLKKVKAQDLWNAIIDAQVETGCPFMLYKDACNKKSNQKNLGTIKSSNLCTEIVQFSSPQEVSVCNLASIALSSFVDQDDEESWFDFEALHKVTKVVARNLDKIIDLNWYPVPEAKSSNLSHRPIAIGVQGFADMLIKLRLPFESIQTKTLNQQIFETIYHAALEASIDLSKENGPYSSFHGSPAHEGSLQFDLWNHTVSDMWDWAKLKHDIKIHGLRNSLVTALMPTASTSQIIGCNETVEPFTSNFYTQQVLAGEFQVINPWLLRDLTKLGLWSDKMKKELIENQGSVQNIDGMPEEFKQLYKTVWEISKRTIIDLAAGRAPFIDQSQSMNIHIKSPTRAKLTGMHFHGWRKGLKTGMYNLHTQPTVNPTQITIPPNSSESTVPSSVSRHLSTAAHRLLGYKDYAEYDINDDLRRSNLIIEENGTLKVLKNNVPKLSGRISMYDIGTRSSRNPVLESNTSKRINETNSDTDTKNIKLTKKLKKYDENEKERELLLDSNHDAYSS